MKPCVPSIQSLYIQILLVSALAVLPDFHRVDGFSELISVFAITKNFSPPTQALGLIHIDFFPSSLLSPF